MRVASRSSEEEIIMSMDAVHQFRRKSAMLNGLTALGATMVAMSAVSPYPTFWRGLMTGVWLTGTLGAVGWQVWLQLQHRHAP